MPHALAIFWKLSLTNGIPFVEAFAALIGIEFISPEADTAFCWDIATLE